MKIFKTVCRPSDPDVNWRCPVQGKSPPVQVTEPSGNSNCLLIGLYPETQICFECLRGHIAVYKERESLKCLSYFVNKYSNLKET